jgi:hypothetical protein
MIRILPVLLLFASLLVYVGCGEANGVPAASDARSEGSDVDQEGAERVLATNLERILAYADSVESALRPEPLLTPGQIAAFDRYRNPDQLARARQLGIPQPVSREAIDRHLETGRLVRLEDNEHYILREMDYAVPLATPDVEALLTEIGQRFHTAIAERGLPPLRLEVTSVLRTADDQARLRRVNPNAARGESTHQFGTTFDIAYTSFVAPQRPILELDTRDAPWMEPYLRQVEALAAETGAARMSRELKAILGHILREMQNEGKVMVTREVRQPVYHMTVARRYR